MATTISVTVRLFASLRERAGGDRVALDVPAGTPIGAVWGYLDERVGLGEPPAGLRYAINDEWTIPGAPMREGDRVALILPVSGG